MTKRPTVYLAGPMAGLTYEEATAWRNIATAALEDYYEIRTPMDRDYRHLDGSDMIEMAEAIVTGDKNDIDHSDVLLIYSDRPSIGTAMETMYAFERDKILILVAPNGATVSPWFTYHVDKVFTNLDDALAHLKIIAKYV